jgi:hypothetical protein
MDAATRQQPRTPVLVGLTSRREHPHLVTAQCRVPRSACWVCTVLPPVGHALRAPNSQRRLRALRHQAWRTPSQACGLVKQFQAPHNPEAPGAYLGHGPGDSKGQQRYRAVTRDLALTSANAREQQRPWAHAVYGMQGVRGSNPLSSTRHNASPTFALSAVCQRFARNDASLCHTQHRVASVCHGHSAATMCCGAGCRIGTRGGRAPFTRQRPQVRMVVHSGPVRISVNGT